MKVVVASGNKGKISEIKNILSEFGWDIVSRDDAGVPPFEVEETGDTLEENSRIKAEAVRSALSDKDAAVIADDTGLEVDALDGAPGVYSARFAGEHCSYEDNNRKLLGLLKDIEPDERTARFATVMTMIFPSGEEIVARGECSGSIATEPRGNNGFGYDPLFIAGGGDVTFAEMSSEEKNRISHRARALIKLEELIREREEMQDNGSR